jgi:hypothetical protein
MYSEQREAMQRVHADRVRRRTGHDPLPSQANLAAEYQIQLRSAQAEQLIIAHDERVMDKLLTLSTEGVTETADLVQILARCRVDQRLSAKMILDRHVAMCGDLA